MQTLVSSNPPIHDDVGCTDGTLVVLSSFPNLRRMEWYCSSFQIAAAQINSVREPCKTIEEVCLKIWNFRENWNEREKDHCMIIDKALAGDNFPSLRLVKFKKGIPWDYFPILQSRNLLKATKLDGRNHPYSSLDHILIYSILLEPTMSIRAAEGGA